jgi:hypothetical protein
VFEKEIEALEALEETNIDLFVTASPLPSKKGSKVHC